MTMTIFTTKGVPILVDDEDYESLACYNWYLAAGYAERYVAGSGKPGKRVRMHRQIMGLEAGDPREVDHDNQIRTDNRRLNLRVCTEAQNQRNKPLQKNSTTGVKGVSFQKAKGKYQAKITINGKRIHIGVFSSLEEAGRAYAEAANRLHGEFANHG